MKPRSVIRLTILGVLAAALNGCGGASATKNDPGPQTALLAPRDVAAVTRLDLATGVPVQGTLQPSVDVSIVTPYPELIEAVLVKEGQAVRRGQVLARMRTQSIAPAAASAEAQRRIAASEFERMKNLFKEGAVSQRDVDNAEAQLRAAEAGAALARKRLDEANVTAAFDGVIARRFVQSGDRVADGDKLFRLVNTDELEFSASVPTEALERVRPGAPVALTVSGLGAVSVTGRVSRVNATVDPATRQVKIYVTVPNRDHRLVGDMFATGRIVLAEAKRALALPSSGVQSAPDGTTLAWVVANGRIERRAITVGLRDEARDLVEVKAGLREGETAIVSPIDGLASGQPVQLTADAAATAPRPAAPGAKPSRPDRGGEK